MDGMQCAGQPGSMLNIYARAEREMASQYGAMPLREQALVDQEVMSVRRELAELGMPITREHLGLYLLSLIQVGEMTGHNPGQPKHAHPATAWFGHRAMA